MTNDDWVDEIFDGEWKRKEQFLDQFWDIWGIWCPPEVRISSHRINPSGKEEQFVQFPRPSPWMERVTNPGSGKGMLVWDMEDWEIEEKAIQIEPFRQAGLNPNVPAITFREESKWKIVPISNRYAPWPAFEKSGWKRKEDTGGLLNDFLAIDQGSDEEDVKDRVKSFALKWGPLWACRNTNHGPDCLWSPLNFGVFGQDEPPERLKDELDCIWLTIEPLSLYRRYSRQARAILQLAPQLLKGEEASRKELLKGWELFYGQELTERERKVIQEEPILYQQWEVAMSLNSFLNRPGGPHFQVRWGKLPRMKEEDGERKIASLMINPGMGFIRSLWLQVAQKVAFAPGVYTCAGCGNFFIPDGGRKRPEGRNHYCSKCGEKAKKRLWARKHRSSPALSA